jgi:RNA-directed DNA polymerase
MERVLDRENMQRAWKRVKANKGAPGIDGMRLEDFAEFACSHWATIRQALRDGTYQPQPVRRVSIPKPSGGERLLGIPTVVDRVIQQAIAQIMGPLFDPGFSDSSFGFRPGRSAHGALWQVQRYIGEGYRVAVDLDLAKFFDHVQHDVLLARVATKVRDKRLLALIGRYLRAGVLVGETLQATAMGTPQGGPLSPLLANVLLDDLDKELERRGHRFARYADDILILVKSPRAGERVMASVTRYLTRTLKLVVNAHKSRVVRTNDCEFLSFTFRGTKLRWSERAFEDFRHNIRRLTGRSWGVSMDYRFQKLAQYVRGWMGYFGISDYYRPIPELDSWMRRRVRMCFWKQWRYVRTKVRHLLALGTGKRQAILTALSSKSYWHLSRTLATQTGMTNDWLKRQGLICIRDLWMKAHGYA